MKTILLAGALLLAASAQAQVLIGPRHVPKHAVALECDSLKDLRKIVRAAAHGGILSSDARYRRINAAARKAGKTPCKRILLDPLLQIKAIEGYHAVEVFPNELYDVVVLEVIGRDDKTRYDAIERFVADGHTI